MAPHEDLKLAEPRFRIRGAEVEDVPAMTDVFFHSFNAPFWRYFIADNPVNRKWWDDSWTMGIQNPTDRSFVVEDTDKSNRIVAFSRWMIPQADGKLDRLWPELPGEWDQGVAGAFFGGMEENRVELMGKRPHWCRAYHIFKHWSRLTLSL
ncbi:hypothetical protein BAUCODRAFT_24807 [Baudoinia panamericana UAMH 10762]|uniref:N-acetyltransferase domain-containing protein n=1 Tax=Baudoinia panamericana (strain UAMH 10762) TaxID=717646 RepID=M2LN80_BAUPA|nr:uncharacterized protein BAUCODRAFT_24807 [Baudoinia panamericana UAMH 10762]EMC95807.1 hypothetical protein BAUCODRAFT_24807 [Baudoinia panamericana UAMH 10762]